MPNTDMNRNYPPRAKLYAFACLLVWSGLSISCRDESDETELPRPSFVRPVISLAGSFPLTWGQPSLGEAHFEVSGCQTLPDDNKTVTIQAEQTNELFQLHEGNMGCSVAMIGFSLVFEGLVDHFAPLGAHELGLDSGESLVFQSENSNRRLLVYPGLGLGSVLEHFETISFHLIPKKSPESSRYVMRDFQSDHAARINLRFDSIHDNNEVNGGDHGIRVVLSCEKLRNFEYCDEISLLDYRLRLVALPDFEYDVNFLMTMTGILSNVSRPTTSHIMGNGLELNLLVPKDSNENLALDALLIIKLGTVFRTFELDLREIIDL